jgi:cytochrome oxidase Cu insertion factor (SCO1/SenC/PrrC family)
VSGMGTGLGIMSPSVVAAFTAALREQGVILALIFALLALTWVFVRPLASRADVAAGGGALTVTARGLSTGMAAEPAGRRVLRAGFGLLWLADGLLQAQPAMPLGLASQVTRPAADGSPLWVRHLVGWGAQVWSFHPVTAAAAAVWIQAGLGFWLLAASRGRWSRLGGLVSAGWGLIVWVFGEAFGGVFAPGLSWLFGAPGAALLYVAAGVLVALPERAWTGARLGRAILACLGLFFTGMAVLQAWPGRGYWQGMAGGQPGGLSGMVQDMAQTPQPGFLASWLAAFGAFTAAHGFAVNLAVVAALAVLGAAMLGGTRPGALPVVARLAVVAAVALCLADWVLVQDMGIFGGLGTDPNSMIPLGLVIVAGYAALTWPQRSSATWEPPPSGAGPASPRPAGRRSLRWPGWQAGLRRAGAALAAAGPRGLGATGALAMVLTGAFPLAAASASRTADPVIAQAVAGPSSPLDYPAPGFALTDQNGRQVSLASLRGKAVLLTFLDPVCTDQCPLIAQEFRQASQMLGSQASRVEFVAVATNPLYYQAAYIRAFNRQEGLDTQPNWLFLTGSLPRLRQVWHDYGIGTQVMPGGQMIAHSEYAYLIGADGRMRRVFNAEPGPGTASSQSSFAGEFAAALRQELSS